MDQCISSREQILIFVGSMVILSQMIIYYIERRHFRNIINRQLPPTPLTDYEHRD